MGKTKYNAIRAEFQERGSLHFHLFIWIFNAPNMENEAAYIEFIEKTLNVQLPDHLNYSGFFELVQTYLVHAHSRTCWKCNKNECRFSYGCYFIEKTIVAKPLDSKFSNDEKQEILKWRNTLPRHVKSYIDNNLNSVKVNVIDPTKYNLTKSLSVKKF